MLADAGICESNRQLLETFFQFEERKLKRQNGLADLDEGCCKTLYGYTTRLRNVNAWFENKPWKDLTKEDIQRVYDALEDGRIRTKKGARFLDKHSYYNKILRSKPFRLAGKVDLVAEVIEFSTESKRVVRYATEDQFRRLVSVVANPRHLLLFWLAWDIGENIDTLLQLTKRDLARQNNRDTGEPEYLVRLAAEKLKRSRRSRSEVTLYPETVRYAEIVLDQIGDNDRLFTFGYRHALKVIERARRRSGAKTEPNREPVRWKDLRSGMACHLLRCGWSRDEVNARLGHTPRSAALDAYINFEALDRYAPKLRMRDAIRGVGGRHQPTKGTRVSPQSQIPQTASQIPSTASLGALHALRDELLSRLQEVTNLLTAGQPLPVNGQYGGPTPPNKGTTPTDLWSAGPDDGVEPADQELSVEDEEET